jgi:hypothetical protein
MPAVLRPALSSVTRRTLNNALARERSVSFCRLRTFFRSPACDATKIRCRRRRTSSPACRQSTAPQSRNSPSGPFTTLSPSAAKAAPSSVAASNLSLGSDAVDHQVFAGSPDARQRSFEPGRHDPYPGGYATPPQGGCGLRCRFPVAFRRPGLRFLRHPVPAEELKRSSQSACQTPLAWTSAGFPRSAGMRHDRGGPLLYPGVAVSSRPTGHNRPAPAASQRLTLHHRPHVPSLTEAVTRHQRRFTLLTRPIFP